MQKMVLKRSTYETSFLALENQEPPTYPIFLAYKCLFWINFQTGRKEKAEKHKLPIIERQNITVKSN